MFYFQNKDNIQSFWVKIFRILKKDLLQKELLQTEEIREIKIRKSILMKIKIEIQIHF